MKGKYINTVIMMAALSGRQKTAARRRLETVASLSNHQLIWSKHQQVSANLTSVRQKGATILC